MTYKVQGDTWSTETREAFATMVAKHIATLKEYDAHEATVRAHAADPDMSSGERWQSLGVPVAPAEIDAAIKRVPQDDGTTDFVADYEIVGPSFEVKKSRLFDQVSTAERDAMAAVVPAGKVRAYQFREADIRKADHARSAADAEPEPRPEADTRFLEEQASREDQRQEIMRHAAQLHSDIEDLTPETIDAWEMKPFNG